MTNDELIKTVKQIIDGLNKETFHGAAMTLTELVTRYEERTAANPLTVDYRGMVEKILIPNGYKTVHIGNPLEVSASQFLYKSQIEHLISELNLYAKPNSRLTVESVVEAVRKYTTMDIDSDGSYRVIKTESIENLARDITKLATPQLDLNALDEILRIFAKSEDQMNNFRQRIGYGNSDITPQKDYCYEVDSSKMSFIVCAPGFSYKCVNLNEIEKLVQHSKNIHRAFGHIWNDMEGTPEEHAIKLRQRIGYTLSDLSPSKPDQNEKV